MNKKHVDYFRRYTQVSKHYAELPKAPKTSEITFSWDRFIQNYPLQANGICITKLLLNTTSAVKNHRQYYGFVR